MFWGNTQLLAVNGTTATSFLELEAAVDDAVGKSIQLTLRRGALTVNVDVPVDDLHAITPSRFYEIGGAVLHDLSFHVALAKNLPVQQGVFVAQQVRSWIHL